MLEDMIGKENPVVELQDLTTYLWKSAQPQTSLRYRRQRIGNDGPRQSSAPGTPTCPYRTPTSSSMDAVYQEPRGSTGTTRHTREETEGGRSIPSRRRRKGTTQRSTKGERESDSDYCEHELTGPNEPSYYLRRLMRIACETTDIKQARRMLFGDRQRDGQSGEGWNIVNENSECRGSCTCGMSDMPGQHSTFGCIPRKGHPWLSPEVITEDDSKASTEEGETSHYYEIMSTVMQQKTLEAVTEQMNKGGRT